MKIPSACLLAGFLVLAVLHQASAFSLLGPFKNQANGAADPWQGRPYAGRVGGLGYSQPGDIGGPMLIEEAYRWNVPIITYGFDAEFIEYFGGAGIVEVEKAIAIFNALPPASEMTPALEEFPWDSKGEDASAAAVTFLDLKSHVMALLLEQMGLADPERFAWCLRDRQASGSGTNYVVLNLNYDPTTHIASRFVNGVAYNYVIFDAVGAPGKEWATAAEWFESDPLYQPYSSVAGSLEARDLQLGSNSNSIGFYVGLAPGQFFTSLTRDDAGGLRFLLNRQNKRWEKLLPGVTALSGHAASFVNAALRPGVEKVTFHRHPYNSEEERFLPVTNIFSDIYFTNGLATTQSLQRLVLTPDVLFRVSDLGGTLSRNEGEANFYPRLWERSDTSTWVNYAQLNEREGGGGPGVIQPPVHLTFNKLGRYGTAAAGWLAIPQWGAFDGTAAPPLFFHGQETNQNTLVVETRLVQTNGLLEFEWTTLKRTNLRYRVETSTNLTDWTLLMIIEPCLDCANTFTMRQPVGNQPRFYRTVQEDVVP